MKHKIRYLRATPLLRVRIRGAHQVQQHLVPDVHPASCKGKRQHLLIHFGCFHGMQINMSFGSRIVSFLSGEWMLSFGRPNGGDVVIFRTLWVGAMLIAVLSAIQSTEVPSTAMCGTIHTVWEKALAMMRGSQGPIVFGAVYLALYARFTSQWTYMANLYNQIKQTELTMPDCAGKATLAQWKAGYIEDAYTTHMATKPMVAGVIGAWYKDQDVKNAFSSYTKNHHEILGWLTKHGVI